MTVVAELDKLIQLLEAEIPANPESQKNQRLRRRLERELDKYFRALGNAFPYSKLVAIYNRNVQESLGSDTRAMLDPLLASFDNQIEAEISGQLAEIYLSGQAEMITWGKTKRGIPIAYEGPPISKAVDWAKKRGAQLVTQMDDTTKKRLARTIADGIANKRGIPGLSADIKSTFADMTRYRSQLIARTETANALSQSSLDNMEGMGIDGKEWVTSGSEFSQKDECGENEAEGAIPVGQAFGSGHQAPPAHPDCECALAPARLPSISPFPKDLPLPKSVEKPIPTLGLPTPKNAADIRTSSDWITKNVQFSSGNKSGKIVADQIIKEVPVKDLKTVTKVYIRDGELRIGNINAAGIYHDTDRTIEMALKQTTNAVTHEFGHAVEASWQGGRTAAEKFYQASIKKNAGFISEYAKVNTQEYFAESYRAYHTMPEVLKAKNQPMYNLFNKRYNP